MQVNDPNQAACAKHMRLLAGQDYYKADEALLDLLNQALIRHADDTAHILRMVTMWVDRTRQMLHPSDIARLASETSDRVSLPAGCNVCRGENFIFCLVNGQECMKRCDCDRGRRLAEIDRRRRAMGREDGSSLDCDGSEMERRQA